MNAACRDLAQSQAVVSESRSTVCAACPVCRPHRVAQLPPQASFEDVVAALSNCPGLTYLLIHEGGGRERCAAGPDLRTACRFAQAYCDDMPLRGLPREFPCQASCWEVASYRAQAASLLDACAEAVRAMGGEFLLLPHLTGEEVVEQYWASDAISNDFLALGDFVDYALTAAIDEAEE